MKVKVTKQDRKTVLGIIGAVIFSQGLLEMLPDWVPALALLATGAAVIIVTQ